MTRISQTVKNMISGVSQQPELLRLPEQLDMQVNGFSTESSGLQKRPPTLYVANLGAVPANKNALVHLVNRDETEKYIMLFDGVGVSVWDENGKAYTVQYEGAAKDYLKVDNPRKMLRLVTIADYTFIVNRNKTVKMADTAVPYYWNDHSCIVNVKSGQYGRTYKILINGTEIASYTTPNGDNAADTQKIDTNFIRDQLGNSASGKGWTVEKYNSCLYLYKADVTIQNVKCVDGFNGQGMFGIFHVAQKFTNLPTEAKDGYTVKVLGENGSYADDYYVTYSAKDNVWKECAEPGIKAGYDASTMPHIMTRNADGTFTVKVADWDDRETGDEDSNPAPSFVDSKINDIFLFRNRLGLLSGENFILSRSASFFNFWVASAVEVQDTDPIDVAVSNNAVDTLYNAVAFSQDLLLFSANSQFILNADGVLTPQNASAPLATQFTSDTNVKPVGAGRRIYYIVKRSEYSSMSEYYTMNDTVATKDAQDITSHVPSFIPNGVYSIQPSNTEHILLVFSAGDTSKIWVYKYLFSEEARMQSSWSYWEFKGGTILGGGFLDSTFYILIARGEALFMEKMIFTYNTKDYEDEPYRVFIDRKAVSSPMSADNYDDINNRTQLHIKNAYGGHITPGASYGVVTSDGHYYEFNYDTVNADNVWIEGNLTGQKLVFGELFQFYIRFSTLMIKRRTDAGIVAEQEGRLQLSRLELNFSDSGYFEIHVDFKDTRSGHIYYHTARILGDTTNKMNIIPMETGSMKVPIMSRNTNCDISIQTEAPTAISLMGYVWEGNYIKRTRSI